MLTNKKNRFPYEVILNLLGSVSDLEYNINEIILSLKENERECIIFSNGILQRDNECIAKEIMLSQKYTINIKLGDDKLSIKSYCCEIPNRNIRKLFNDESVNIPILTNRSDLV